MKQLAIILCLGIVLTLPASAEIEKLAIQCETGLCLYWWPKLPELPGWTQDRSQSFHYEVNALAPTGSDFANAPSVIYARAIYKPRRPEIKSLPQLIASDQAEFKESAPGVRITELPKTRTADGSILLSFTYFPENEGNWERVDFGEENDFYLIFTLSSRTKSAFEAALPDYLKLIHSYEN